jgi:hypothetical protein
MVLDALKKRLHDAANTEEGKWIKELPNALWELCTQPTKPTGQSPYFLVYESEAILLITPVFPKKTKCITICMPGSSFMHIVT